MQYTGAQFFDPYIFVQSQSELWWIKCKKLIPQLEVKYDVEWRSLNYALSYDAIITPRCMDEMRDKKVVTVLKN